MQTVKFLQGFQGTETRNIWYDAGMTGEFDEATALDLANRKVVELVEETPSEKPTQKTTRTVKRGRK